MARRRGRVRLHPRLRHPHRRAAAARPHRPAAANGWEAIAHLRWGGWNANPATEHHVAALRSWHDRFGAELVGAGADVLNLHVAIRPATRDAALALAREQHLYCADIVDQGVETLSALAATLMADDWWYFWWD